MSHLVSTIIPVYNRPGLLREAAHSVLRQTHRPIEIIIVDDGSTDETPAVAEMLAREHPEIRLLRQENAGPGAARERGRLAAAGEFIQYLDSDDLLLPHKFEVQVRALVANPACGAAYGWTREYGAPPEPRKRSGERIETMFPSMLTERWWDTPTPLYRAEVVAAAGPWSTLRAEEDWEYDCRIASSGIRLAYCPEWVCEVRLGAPGHLSMRVDAATLHDRARAHLLILSHARAARLGNATSEMQFFARDLFHLSRQCGSAGLIDDAVTLARAARSISDRADIRAYERIAALIGWRMAGRAAAVLDRFR